MARKNELNYFETFVKGVDYACRAAEMLRDNLRNYDPASLPDRMKELHEIEHAADIGKHEMMGRLARDFITPIEREDIMELANKIDDVTDSIEDVLMRAYMFNIKTVREESHAFSEVIVTCCAALKKMLEEFHNFHKSSVIKDLIIDINKLEEDGDRIYTQSVHHLYATCTDPVEIIAWTELFDRFEKCCDLCEDVADVVESVIMKNT